MDKMRSFIKDAKIGTKIVMDHDDDVFNISPLSDHYAEHGTEEIKIMNGGKVVYEWKDGINIDLKCNRKRMDEVKRSLEMSDMVTVTTEELAKVFRPYNDNVKVLPNCIDINEWNRLPILRENKDEIRICWMGGASHWEDLHMVRNALKEVCDRHKNVKMVVVGYMPAGMKEDFKPEQLEYHDWIATPAHPYRLAGLDIDISVIPLRDTIFNRGKSPIKWIEMSALKIPSITSYVTPYKEVCDMDESESGIYIEKNDTNGWIKGLELLIDSPEFRKTLGEKARKFVEDNFDINKKYHLWIDAYKGVLCDSRQPSCK
jgi:glycosyltransferase involved in cell wall biosynthesis